MMSMKNPGRLDHKKNNRLLGLHISNDCAVHVHCNKTWYAVGGRFVIHLIYTGMFVGYFTTAGAAVVLLAEADAGAGKALLAKSHTPVTILFFVCVYCKDENVLNSSFSPLQA